MNVKAVFPEGVYEIFVNGLHQWDYGQKLEIEAEELPAMIEVHFACPSMTEAIVRTCAVNTGSGTATVTIPDICLEQSAPITAWIYQLGGSSGATVKVIKMIVTPRPRPASGNDVDVIESSKYAELISAVNNQVANLKAGGVVVNKALRAENSDYATNATHSTNSDYATRAEFASEDISKGTIEARLSSLGFKSGAFGIKYINPSGSPDGTPFGFNTGTNEIKKCGNFAIGTFTAGAGFSIDGVESVELTVPDEFKPDKYTELYAFISFVNPLDTDGDLTEKYYVTCPFTVDGKIKIKRPSTMSNVMTQVQMQSVGWVISSSVTSPMIKFSINDSRHYAERGMTWGKWVESPYNLEGYKISDGYVVNSSGFVLEVADDMGGTYAWATEVIPEDGDYTV